MTFQKAADARWRLIFGDMEHAPCEGDCGRWIPRGTVPHHTRDGRRGMGRKRTHDPMCLVFYCEACHLAAHGLRWRG